MTEKEPSLSVPLSLKDAVPLAAALSTSNKASSTSSQEIFSGYLSSVRSSNSSDASSRAQSPLKNRANTPPTPASIPDFSPDVTVTSDPQLKVRFYQTHQDEYLSLIEPNPVCPPRYDSLPPGGCPRYPIVDTCDSRADPPAYAPAIYKIGMVSRKLEWLTPYEPSPSRAWRSVIMELNSTQLNFYQIPNTLESHLQTFKPIIPSMERTYNETEEKDIKDIKSELTSDADLQFYKYCQRLHLLSESSPVNIMDEDMEKLQRKSNSKRLVRSYSLQHARVGLATDYKKKPNVLRLRIESEQILIHFPTTRDLISWNMSIGIGKDIALDLNERELPRFRTVPRRRRRQISSNSERFHPSPMTNTGSLTQFFMADSSRQRSGSELSRLKGKLQKLKFKLSSSRSDSKTSSASNRARSNTSMTINSSMGGSVRLPNLEITRSNSMPNFLIFGEMTTETREDAADNMDNFLNDDEDDYYYEEDTYEISTERRSSNVRYPSSSSPISPQPKKTATLVVPVIDASSRLGSTKSTPGSLSSTPTLPQSTSTRNRTNTDDYDEEDIQNMSDLHHSDDEDDADDEDDEVVVGEEEDEDGQNNEEGPIIEQSMDTSFQALATGDLYPVGTDLDCDDESDEDKWFPGSDRLPSKRKFYRNCLRCIKPLNLEDSWVGKSVVKPTTLSPLNFAYLRNVKYNTSNNSNNSTLGSFFSHSSSTTSLASMNSMASSNGTITVPAPTGPRKHKLFSFKDTAGFVLPDSALTKVPSHFLKEYFVGSHGLIPKEV